MYLHPKPNQAQFQPKGIPASDHVLRVKNELTAAGISRIGMRSFASRYLPLIIHENEHIGGVVYGRQTSDTAMLIATDHRILFLDKKPLFVDEDEVTYDVVSGISFSHAGFGSTITLHTRIKDFSLRTLNQRAARIFMEYVEGKTQIRSQRKDYF